MIDSLKNISLYFIISVVINWGVSYLESSFLLGFLEKNLVSLLVALLAINTTTLSVIMVKLRELKDKYGFQFEGTLKSLRFAIYEEVFLIPFSVLILTLRDSYIISVCCENLIFILDSLAITCFAYSIHIVLDTAKAVFIIISFEGNAE